MIRFGDLKRKLRGEIFPFPGLPASQLPAVESFFLGGIIDVQKFIPCLQAHNVDVHKFCSTFFECGATIVEFPKGRIDRVYTISNGDFCDPVELVSSNYRELLCFRHNLLGFTAPLNVGLPRLPMGFRYAEKITDSTVGRSRTGIWAWHNNRLYTAPWIQSNESLIVEWSGPKRVWNDDDLLDEEVWTEDYLEVLKAYVEWRHALRFGGEVPMKQADYQVKLADQIWSCNQMIEQQAAVECGGAYRQPTAAEIADDAVPAEEAIVFAAVGDLGYTPDDDAKTELVADLIKSWSPEFILGLGDLFYGAGGATSYDTKVGQFYNEFLFPYTGEFGDDSGKTRNRFWPVIGNHDRDPVGNLGRYKAFFKAVPQQRNYYDVVIGPIHVFVIDDGYDNGNVQVANPQLDGNTFDSVQGQWLKAKLKLSTAPFKIVCLHHPPYTSVASGLGNPPGAGDGTLSYPALRWPFAAWGATVTLHGHAHVYERLKDEDGFTYLIAGLGGRQDIPTFRDPLLDFSQAHYRLNFGALRGTCTCESLKFEFINLDGAVIDTVEFKASAQFSQVTEDGKVLTLA